MASAEAVFLPAVRRGDQVSGSKQPVEQIKAGSLLASNQRFALAFLPTVTVCGGGCSFKPGEHNKRHFKIISNTFTLL